MNVIGPGRRIVGAAGGKEVTLEGCVIQNTSIQSPGIFRQRYYVPMVFTGLQFDPNDALDFDKVTVSFDHLPFWINRNDFGWTAETEVPNDLSTVTKFTVTARRLPAPPGGYWPAGPAAGIVYQQVRLTNRSNRPCTLSAGPTAVTGARVTGGMTTLTRIAMGDGFNLVGPGPANLRPGQSGWVTLSYRRRVPGAHLGRRGRLPDAVHRA